MSSKERTAIQRALLRTRLAGALIACVALTGCRIDIEPVICGGIAGFPCPAGQFCRFDEGVCGRGDQSGLCEPIPDACIELFDPVCGCDGETYSNDCAGFAAGVSVDIEGACEDR